MIEAFHATKLVVDDLPRAEAFYTALGLVAIHRNLGGSAEVRQQQVWLATGLAEAPGHVLILSRFTELPAAVRAGYPGEAWLAFRVGDVDRTIATALAHGGALVRAGEDIADYQVRAGLVSDPDGHVVELVGPLPG